MLIAGLAMSDIGLARRDDSNRLRDYTARQGSKSN
jgi:hypothetical protein